MKFDNEESKPFVFYGTGEFSVKVFDWIKHLNPVCFIDANEREQNKIHLGLPVLSLSAAKERFGDFDVFITESVFNLTEVYEKLTEQGIPRKNIDDFSSWQYKQLWKYEHLRILDFGSQVAVKGVSKGYAPKVAVQIHVFYTELMKEIVHALSAMPFEFDCFVSTDTATKREVIELEIASVKKAKKVYVEVFENRGRDCAPLLIQMKERINEYEYFCHIHTKKSGVRKFGEIWRKHSYSQLLGSENRVLEIFEIFEDNSEIGIIIPDVWLLFQPMDSLGENKAECLLLADQLGLDLDLDEEMIFPAGNMFWARTDAVMPIFQLGLDFADFPKESGQTDVTLAHAIERIWVAVAKSKGYEYGMIRELSMELYILGVCYILWSRWFDIPNGTTMPPPEGGVILYGAGAGCMPTISFCRQLQPDIEFACIVDVDEQKQGKTILDIPVMPIEYLKKADKNTYVIVTVLGDKESIAEMLRGLGFFNILTPASNDYGAIMTAIIKRRDTYIAENRQKMDLLLQENTHKINAVRQSLSHDKKSLRVFDAKFQSSFYAQHLPLESLQEDNQYFVSIIPLSANDVFVDCGAYDGQTTLEFFDNASGGYAYVFEPDPWQHKVTKFKLKQVSENCTFFDIAVCNHVGEMTFKTLKHGSSKLFENGDVTVKTSTLDVLLAGASRQPTFIKMDIEGAEIDALEGARKIISANKPKLAISCYHDLPNTHIWEIPYWIISNFPNYKIFMRQHANYNETVCYAIDKR